MSIHPFDQPRVENNPFQDAQDLARDLAFGALNGYWGTIITFFRGAPNFFDRENEIHQKFLTKWHSEHKPIGNYGILLALGHLQAIPNTGQSSMTESLMIGKSAFELVKAPFVPSKVFVSYRRRESSAFALLIEARLRIAGVPTEGIFVDKNMTGGERWENRIHREIEQCDYFVCLIGPTTLADGSWVSKEIEILKQTNPKAIAIPVCHNGFRLGQLPETLAKSNGYELAKPTDEETALDYETAVNFVLNSMGYRTY
jgi:hypothetical protein